MHIQNARVKPKTSLQVMVQSSTSYSPWRLHMPMGTMKMQTLMSQCLPTWWKGRAMTTCHGPSQEKSPSHCSTNYTCTTWFPQDNETSIRAVDGVRAPRRHEIHFPPSTWSWSRPLPKKWCFFLQISLIHKTSQGLGMRLPSNSSKVLANMHCLKLLNEIATKWCIRLCWPG